MLHPQCGVGYNALENKYASFSNIQVIYTTKSMKWFSALCFKKRYI